MVLKWCSRRVFAVFKAMERHADRATGAVGPVFISIAGVILSGGTFACFEVIIPSGEPSALNYALSCAWAIYVVICIAFHYYISISVPPGSPRPHPPMITITDASSAVESDRQNGHAHGKECEIISAYYLASLPPIAKLLATAVVSRLAIQNLYSSKLQHHSIAPAVVVSCRKCLALRPNHSASKPERCHHCRICQTCCLKYDHHCPWINQCVGHQNERSFVLFLSYLSVGCFFILAWGWKRFKHALDFRNSRRVWEFFTPRWVVILIWALSLAIGPAVGIMAAWQLYMVARGETSVEAQDNEYYTKMMKDKGSKFVNVFDLGYKRNLAVFFSLDSPWWTILLPLPIPPQGDGWKWEKVEDWEKHQIEDQEQLTDGEDE